MSGTPTTLIGRDEEVRIVRSFIDRATDEGGALGKTAAMDMASSRMTRTRFKSRAPSVTPVRQPGHIGRPQSADIRRRVLGRR